MLAVVLLCLVCLSSLRAGQAEEKVAKDDKAKAVKGRLVVQGKGYLIHAFPRTLPVTEEKAPALFNLMKDLGGRQAGSGLALLHTATATGEARCILASGRWTRPGPPMGIDRLYHGQTRIAGTAVDGSRLYVAWWHGGAVELLQGAPQRPPQFGRGKYRLLVFSLADGKKLQELDLKGDGLPEQPPTETVDKGPLQVRDGGVSCFDIAFEVRDGRLVATKRD
jgi:hypothetical protein